MREQSQSSVDAIEKPFVANKPFKKVAYLKTLEQLPKFYRAHDFEHPDERGELAKLFYLYMRAVDDVVDCDQPGVVDDESQREKAREFLAARYADQEKSSGDNMSVIFG